MKIMKISLLIWLWMVYGAYSIIDFTKYQNYGVSQSITNFSLCSTDSRICIKSCINDASCKAIGFEGTQFRCETIKLIYSSPVQMVYQSMSTIWVKYVFIILSIIIMIYDAESHLNNYTRKIFAEIM